MVTYRLDKARRPSAYAPGRACSPTFLCGLPRAGRAYFLEVWPYAANSSLNSNIIVFFNYFYCIGIVPCLLASVSPLEQGTRRSKHLAIATSQALARDITAISNPLLKSRIPSLLPLYLIDIDISSTFTPNIAVVVGLALATSRRLATNNSILAIYELLLYRGTYI